MGKPSARSERGRVVIKARPTALGDEEALGDAIEVFEHKQVFLQRPNPLKFKADKVYLPLDGDSVYEDEVQGLVSSLFQGINATVFAYGATASGKTYTVLGNPQQKGLVDRVTEDLFERFDHRTCKLSVMVEELYCETFTDLLSAPDSLRRPGTAPIPSKAASTPRQPAAGTKYKAVELEADSREQLDELLQRSLQKRRTANTLLNERSSRSHVVITFTLTQHIPVAYSAGSKDPAAAHGSGSSSPISRSSSGQLSKHGDGPGAGEGASDSSSEAQAPTSVTTYLIGKLYLVDLAGSENIKRSGAEGRQQKEAGEINKSLCHLKTVIEEIFRGNKVPTYRNSKLTFRLQDALGGGNSKLLVIACISTVKSNLAETKETLRFAEMARSIENKPVVNTQPKDALIKSLEYEIEVLKDQLQQASKGSTVPAEVYQQLSTLEAAYARLQEEKDMLEDRASSQQVAAAARETSLRQQLDQASSEFGAFKSAVAACEQRLQQQLVTAEANASGQLAAARASARALQQELDAQRVAASQQQQDDSWRIKELRQQLETEQADAQQQQQQIDQLLDAVANTTAALQTANAQLSESDEQCANLQEQLTAQNAATDAARDTCREQQELLEQLQQQLAQQSTGSQDLKQLLDHHRQQASQLQQQLQLEQQSKQIALGELTAAYTSVQQVSEQCGALQEQLTAQQQRQNMATATCSNCMDSAVSLRQQLAVERANTELMKASLIKQEQCYDGQLAAAAQQAQQVTAQHEEERQHWQQELHTARSSISQLQQQVEAAASTHAAEVALLQQEREVLVHEYSAEVAALRQHMQAAAAAHAATAAELQQRADAAARAHAVSVADLQRQAAERTAELARLRQQAAAAAASHAAEVSELQQQAALAAAAHAAEAAGLRQQHQEELDRIQQQSMQKANTEKLRCKEHLALQVHNLMADAQSLSEALAAGPVVVVPAETPLATPLGSPCGGVRHPATTSPALSGADCEADVVSPPSLPQQQQITARGLADTGSSRRYAGNAEQQDIGSESDAASSSSSTGNASASESDDEDETETHSESESEAEDADPADHVNSDDHVQGSHPVAADAGDLQHETTSSSYSDDSDHESSCSLADTYLRQHQHPNMKYTHLSPEQQDEQQDLAVIQHVPADEYLRQHQHSNMQYTHHPEQQQEEQQDSAVIQHTPASGMSPGPQGVAILGSPLPAVSPVIASTAAAAQFKAAATAAAGLTADPEISSSPPAAAEAEAGKGTCEWPTQYQPKELVDESAAASLFQQLTGGSLTVKGLRKFLREKELCGQRHSTSMRLGTEGSYTQGKRKHELIQDFVTWHNHQVAAAAAAAVDSSTSSPVSFSETSSPVTAADPPAAAAALEAPGCPAAELTTPPLQWPGSSSSGGVEVIDLCTPDTSKAAAVMAEAAANAPIEASPPTSGSSIWDWFTPKSSAKKTKSRTAAAGGGGAAAAGGGDGHVKQEYPVAAGRMRSHNAQKRPVSTAGTGDDGRTPSKQQQRGGPLAVAATAGPAAVAEGAAANPQTSSGVAEGAAGTSMLELFLQNHCSPDPKAPAGAGHGPLITMEKLLAARRAHNSEDTFSGGAWGGGASYAGLERRAREVRISGRRR